jgi:hypothetical protein
MMATLTTEEKQKIRRGMERKAYEVGLNIRWIKAAANDAAQAVEDALQAAKPSISTDIDTATTSYGITFTNAEKRYIGALVMEVLFSRDILG